MSEVPFCVAYRWCIEQAVQEASKAEASVRAAEQHASSANADTTQELRDTQERLRDVEVKSRQQRAHAPPGAPGSPQFQRAKVAAPSAPCEGSMQVVFFFSLWCGGVAAPGCSVDSPRRVYSWRRVSRQRIRLASKSAGGLYVCVWNPHSDIRDHPTADDLCRTP